MADGSVAAAAPATRRRANGPVAWLGRRDPGFTATRRSVRAAIVVPGTFALADVAMGNTAVALFAAFGAVAFTLFTDFGGRPSTRLRAYLVLYGYGLGAITVGTLCSRQTALATVSMAVVGFCVLDAGAVSPQAATGATAALLVYILSVAVPATPSGIAARIAGWSLAAAIAIPAVMLTSPVRWHDELRRRIAAAACAVAELVQAHAEGRLDPGALEGALAATTELRRQFETTPYRPTGAGPGDVAVSRLVGRMEWVAANAALPLVASADALASDAVRRTSDAAAVVLRDLATAVAGAEGHPTTDPAVVARLVSDAARLDETRTQAADDALAGFLGSAGAPSTPAPWVQECTGEEILARIDPSFRVRALAFATETAAEAGVDASEIPPGFGPRGWLTRLGRAVSFARVAARVLVESAGPRSVWFRNSVRGAVALALAVLIAKEADVQHAFWVVLGALSVLRSNALGTGATIVRALLGTVAGFVIGSAILVAIGTHQVVLWVVLPLAVLAAGIAPSVISFAAGQAGFTVLVVILFNIIQPVGWRVGLLRVEDVAIGCAVSLVVGILFWPRGSTRQLARSLAASFTSTAALFLAAIEHIAGGAPLSRDTLAAADADRRRLEETFRLYVSERGAKPVPLSTVVDLISGAARVRLASANLSALPMPSDASSIDPLPAVGAAADDLRRVAQSRADAFAAVGEALVDGRPSVRRDHTPDRALLHRLVAAFDASRAARRPEEIRTVLRMMWANERLEDLDHLCATLSDAAEGFHRAFAGSTSV